MPLLEVSHLSKHYHGVAALEDVDLAAEAGEIHAIVGANGAGKSTLMNVLSGATTPTTGRVTLGGNDVSLTDPIAAQALGIATVYQEFSLVPQISVARNIFLGREPRVRGRFGLIDERRLLADTRSLLQRFSIRLDPAAEVSTLSVAQQQMVEIARALSHSARILILDEPTAVLSLTEQANLFSIMRRLRKNGLLLLYVSHRLEEILAVADRVTVLRDGRKVGTRPVAELSIPDIVGMMIGRQTAVAAPSNPVPAGAGTYRIEYTTDDGREEIEIRAGEIVGLAGLVGAGRTTFARAVAGHARPGAEARVRTGDTELRLSTPRQAMKAGVVYLTEDRKADGIFAGLDIVSNAVVSVLPEIGHVGLRRPGRERSKARDVLKRLRLVARSLDMPVAKLSGGNQQKVVLGRALLTEPKLLICDEPTRGVDVGAKAEIHDILRQLAARGTALIVVSSEIEELLAVSNRIVVMADRRFVTQMSVEHADEEAILLAASGGQKEMEPA